MTNDNKSDDKINDQRRQVIKGVAGGALAATLGGVIPEIHAAAGKQNFPVSRARRGSGLEAPIELRIGEGFQEPGRR